MDKLTFSTNYRVKPVSEKPDKPGTYEMQGPKGLLPANIYDPEKFGTEHGGWFLFNNPKYITHYLVPLPDSVVLTRDQVVKMIRQYQLSSINDPEQFINSLLDDI